MYDYGMMQQMGMPQNFDMNQFDLNQMMMNQVIVLFYFTHLIKLC